MDKKSFDHLKFGEPSSKDKSKMSLETPLIGISADQIPVNNPYPNASDETISELRAILKAVSDRGQDIDYIKIADEKPIKIFQSFANDNGLKFDENYFKQLKKDLSSLILALKFRFNRPRPAQLLKVLLRNEGDEAILDFETANTPSYPSGHAIQSYVVANILSELNPKFRRLLENIADRIAHTRIQAGVHYPSDIVIGKEIANMIDRYIKKPNEVYGLALETDFRKITRGFLREEYQDDPIKLRVIDFDDTLANTAERVIITTGNGGGHKYISSEEFAVYDLQPGESIDPEVAFEEFDRVDSEKATAIPLISSMLRSFTSAPGNRKLLILTARSQDVADDVMHFLERVVGISNPSEKIDFIGVSNKDPVAKVDVIKEIMDENPAINFVSFYDDSGKNVRAVHDFLDNRGFSRGRDQRDVRQVIKDEDGNIRLVNTLSQDEEMSEALDFRKMTRNFLMMS